MNLSGKIISIRQRPELGNRSIEAEFDRWPIVGDNSARAGRAVEFGGHVILRCGGSIGWGTWPGVTDCRDLEGCLAATVDRGGANLPALPVGNHHSRARDRLAVAVPHADVQHRAEGDVLETFLAPPAD